MRPFDGDVAEVHGAASILQVAPPRVVRCPSMRIERSSCVCCRLPLVRFFETSFGRVYDRTFLLVTVEGDGARGRGASASPTPTRTTAPRPPRRRGTSSPSSSRRSCSAATFDASARGLRGAARDPRPQHGEGRRRDGRLGPTRAPAGPAARARCSAARARIASGVSIGIQDSSTSCSRRSRSSAGRRLPRIKIKIKPGWDVEAVDACARFGDIPLMVDANAAYTLDDGAPGAARRVRPDDDRAAARLRRHVMDHARCSRRSDAICLDESIHTVRIAARRDRRRRLPDHQHQAGPGRTSRCPATSPPATATTRQI